MTQTPSTPDPAVHVHPDEGSDWDESVEQIPDIKETADEPLDDSIEGK